MFPRRDWGFLKKSYEKRQEWEIKRILVVKGETISICSMEKKTGINGKDF